MHAPIDRDPNWDNMTDEERERSGVFLEMPRVFGTPGCVLKLKKSLYGLKQSPRNFFNHLNSVLFYFFILIIWTWTSNEAMLLGS